MIQKAVNDWGRLVQATRGSLKPKKCHVRINSCNFCNGKAVLKMVSELTQQMIIVPQKDRIPVPILIVEPTMSKKTLGILTNITGKQKDQLDSMIML